MIWSALKRDSAPKNRLRVEWELKKLANGRVNCAQNWYKKVQLGEDL